MSPSYWSVPQEWARETAFIVGGGPSVLGQDLDMLRGRRVIVINSSVHAAPWADFLFFGDWRWWNEPENRAAVHNFAGRVVTTSRLVSDKKVKLCRKTNPPGLALERNALMQKWTSLTAATNLAAHLVGCGGTIVWLGADGRKAADGRTHHHKPHRWTSPANCYERHRGDIVTMIEPLRNMGITLVNATPGSAYAGLFPSVDLQDLLERRAA